MNPDTLQTCTACPTTTTSTPPCATMSDAQFVQPISVGHYPTESQSRNLSKIKRLFKVQSEETRSKNPSKTSGYRSSMSNVSGDSGWVCTEPSSSGSSLQADVQHEKDQKKEEIKRCLQELKSLMPRQARSSKTGAISTLQSLLQHMKKIKGTEESAKAAGTIDTELMGGLPETADCSSFDHTLFPYPDEGTKRMRIVLSARDSQVLQVSPELTDMLGYPKNYWFNQSLLDYAYKRDIVTLSNHLTFSGHDLSKHAQPSTSTSSEEGGEIETQKMFFFRVRHFKSLRQGFSLSRGDKYSVLCGHVRRQRVDLSFPSGTPAEGLQPNSMYLVLECLPITSAYLNLAPDTLPEKRSFTTRHTIYCNFNFIHPSAIPLLGYLPQDMIGSSVFDYYHPQDLPILLGVYQQVVMLPGATVKSAPYRMRTKNGEYITMETEWSSFMNPWSHHLDFIIGQHQVLSAPNNLDVFKETGHHRPHVEFSPEAKAIQKKIKSLLLPSVVVPQPPTMTPGTTLTSGEMPCSDSIPPSSSEDPPCLIAEKEEESGKPPERENVKSSPSPPDSAEEILPKDEVPGKDMSPIGSSSQLAFYQDKRDLLYERLNYAQSIVRFLMSQVSDESESGHRRSKSVSKENESSDGEEIAMEMDLPIPKPPSFASSTKALVSEQEQREEFQPPSPAHEELPEEGHPKDMEHDDVYQPISLTENALKMHNIFQERYYIQRMVREKEGFLTADGRFSSTLMSNKSHKSSQKRVHSDLNDGLHNPAAKFSRNMDSKQVPQWHNMSNSGHHLQPPFPITKVESIPTIGQPGRVTSPKGSGQTSMTNSAPSQVMNSAEQIPQRPSFMRMNDLSSMPSTSFGFYQDQPGMPVQIRLASTHAGQPVVRNTSLVSNATLAGYQWPCFSPQPGNMATHGMPFVQPIFYQPILTHSLQSGPVLSQSLTAPQLAVTTSSLSSTTTLPANTCKMHVSRPAQKSHSSAAPKSREAKRGTKDNESSESLSMETSSSLMYLLESNSGSLNNSSPSENDQLEDVDKKKKVLAEPPWLSTVEWRTDCMRYTVPQRDLKKVLREDRIALKKMKQPIMSIEQLQELLYQLEDNTKDDVSECSADDVLMSGDEMPLLIPSLRKSQVDTASTSDACSSPLNILQPISPISTIAIMENSLDDLDIGEPTVKDSADVEMAANILDDKSSDQDSSKMQPSPPPTGESDSKACASPDKIGNESDTSDTGSKGSSELTPSDQRSHGDTGSSLKESDNASSGSSKENKDNASSESETDGLFMGRHFCKLFIPLNVECDNQIQLDPAWLVGVNFSEGIQMEYQKDSPDVKYLLEDDCRTLRCLQQPELVKEQLKELVRSLRIPGTSPVDNQTQSSVNPVSTEQIPALSAKEKREENAMVGVEYGGTSESKDDSDSGCIKTPSSNQVDSESDKDISSGLQGKKSSEEGGNTSDDAVTMSDDDRIISTKESKASDQSDDASSQNDSGKSTGSGSGSGNQEGFVPSNSETWEHVFQRKLHGAGHRPFFDAALERNSSSPNGSGISGRSAVTAASTAALASDSELSSEIETLMGHLFSSEEEVPFAD